MNHIKNLVVQIVKTSSPDKDWKAIIMQNWSEIIGSLASKVFIEKIHNDTITLAVTDSCWMQELHLLSELIKSKINKTLSQPRIQTVRFKYATKKIFVSPKSKKANVIFPFVPKPLTLHEQQALLQIKDPELSQALMRFLQKCHHLS
jgi:hypothetical protein